MGKAPSPPHRAVREEDPARSRRDERRSLRAPGPQAQRFAGEAKLAANAAGSQRKDGDAPGNTTSTRPMRKPPQWPSPSEGEVQVGGEVVFQASRLRLQGGLRDRVRVSAMSASSIVTRGAAGKLWRAKPVGHAVFRRRLLSSGARAGTSAATHGSRESEGRLGASGTSTFSEQATRNACPLPRFCAAAPWYTTLF